MSNSLPSAVRTAVALGVVGLLIFMCLGAPAPRRIALAERREAGGGDENVGVAEKVPRSSDPNNAKKAGEATTENPQPVVTSNQKLSLSEATQAEEQWQRKATKEAVDYGRPRVETAAAATKKAEDKTRSGLPKKVLDSDKIGVANKETSTPVPYGTFGKTFGKEPWERCTRRPLGDVSQCFCIYRCVRFGGFFLMAIYDAPGAQRMGPEHRLAVMFGAALRRLSKKWTEPGVVVDIGANDGEDTPHWWSNFAGGQSNAGRHFFLFEPQDVYLPKLKQIVTHNERKFNGTTGYVIQGGAGTAQQHGKTLYLLGEGLTAKLVEETDPQVKGSKKRKTLPKVKMFSVESLLEERGLGSSQISYLKVDTEGADATILHSSLVLFKTKRVQLGVMEWHADFVKRYPIQVPQVVEEIRSCGYRIFMMGMSGPRPILAEMPTGSLDIWPAQLETVVFVLESSGLLSDLKRGTSGPIPVLGRETTPQRQEVFRNMTIEQNFSRKRIRRMDCAKISDATDIGEYCFGDVLAFPKQEKGTE